jgi:cytosine/adenosine deaminase-related metal-dependent hydrolase
MVTENPGHFIGRNGALHIGGHADMVLFDWSPQQPVTNALEIQNVYLSGEEVK